MRDIAGAHWGPPYFGYQGGSQHPPAILPEKSKLSCSDFETKCPKATAVLAHFCIGLWWYIPRRRLLLSTGRNSLSRVHSTAACGGLPLTACSGCAILPGAAGDISSRAAPFPMIGKGRGDRVERAVKPLIFHGWTVSI